MQGLIVLTTLSLGASAAQENVTQLTSPVGIPVREIYGNPTPKSIRQKHASTNPAYQRVRVPDNCTFPLDIVILQDATASFADDYEEMKRTQLKLVTDAISSTHPGSRFAIMSFKDKPIFSLGDADDYCFYENLPLNPTNFTSLYNAYDDLRSYGGADPAENQLGAMVAAVQSKTIGWDQNPLASKLIVVATDAWYHYDADGLNKYGMAPFNGVIDFVNPATQCLGQYYPSPVQARAALASIGAYAGFLIFDPEWAAGRPLTEWQWFNGFIEQDSNFITTAKSDSSDFWVNLAKIIATIENDECVGSSTIAPPATTVAPTTVAPATVSGPTSIATTVTVPTTASTNAPTTIATQTTILPTTVAPTDISTASVPSTGCPTVSPCPCDPCPCPEVVIKLRQRPAQLHLDVENDI